MSFLDKTYAHIENETFRHLDRLKIVNIETFATSLLLPWTWGKNKNYKLLKSSDYDVAVLCLDMNKAQIYIDLEKKT